MFTPLPYLFDKMFTNANYADKERMEYAMEKIKVLVVDDESRMRKLVSDFLTRDGYEVIEAGDGEEAVEIFFQNKDIAAHPVPHPLQSA